jgi:hypothetical protein
MALPERANQSDNGTSALVYYEMHKEHAVLSDRHFYLVFQLLRSLKDQDGLTLRAIQRLFSVLQITTIPHAAFEDEEREEMVIASLAVVKALKFSVYKRVKTGNLGMEALQDIYIMKQQTEDYNEGIIIKIFDSWQYFLEPEKYATRFNLSQGRTANLREKRLGELRRLMDRHLEVFRLPTAT